MEITYEEMKSTLLKPLWTNKDIMLICGVGSTTASKIRQKAIDKFNGMCIEDLRKVKRNAVLKYLNDGDLSIESNLFVARKEEALNERIVN